MKQGENGQLQRQFFTACREGNLQQAKDCVERGCVVNGVFDEICSYLAISVYEGHKDVVQYLLEKGADPSRDNAPLEAAYTGNAEILQVLLNNGCDPNVVARTGTGETPLHVAACRGHRKSTTDCVRQLLSAGANPNVHANNRVDSPTYGGAYVVGETPLHLAAAFGDEDMVRALLDAGADPMAKDADGHTPRQYYARQQRDEPHVLLKHGALRDLLPCKGPENGG